MIVVSNFSQRFAKQLGDNPVPVLATLILLSYTKILRTLISVLYVTYLEYPTHDRRCGCMMETLTILVANASHFSSGSVCLSLPFSSIHSCFFFFSVAAGYITPQALFMGPQCQAETFHDAYHAPYKAKHRYWPGLLLV